jgi:hypothetical protein
VANSYHCSHKAFDGSDYESKYYYLLISFDLKYTVIDIIEDKVMPFIEKNREFCLIGKLW